MSSLSFLAPDVLTAALLALGAFIIGRRLCVAVPFDSSAERVGISMAVGLGAIGLLVFFIGLAGGLTRPVVVAAGALGVLACAAGERSWPGDLRGALARWRDADRFRPRTLGLTCLLVVVMLPILALAFYPPTAWDATMYHLPMAKAYVQHQRVEPTVFFRYPVFPQLNEMLFTVGLMFSTDIAAHLAQLTMLLVTALLVYALARRVASPRAGFWAAAMWLGTPSAVSLGTSGMIDIGLGLFVLAACYAFARWRASDHRAWLASAGLLAGYAAGCKYTGLFFLGALGLVVAYAAVRSRRWADLGAFCLTAVLTGAPWYVYNAVTSGNPVFPFFGQLFGYGFWNADDLRDQLADMARYGMGKSFSALLALPWNLNVHRYRFNMTAPLSPWYLVLSPLALGAGVSEPRLRGFLAIALAYTLFWFATVQEARYLHPVLPLFCVCAAVGLDGVVSRVRPDRARSMGVVLLIAAALVAPSSLFAAARIARHGPPPASAADRHAYLARRLPSYPAFRLLNERHGTRYRVYALHRENMAYFADGTFMGDWFGPARYAPILRSLGDSRALSTTLTRLGADYFLVSSERRDVKLPDDAFFRQRFEPVYAQDTTRVFRLIE